MKTPHYRSVLLLTICIILFVGSCKKDEVLIDPNLSIATAASDEAMASRLSDGILSNIEQIISSYTFTVPSSVKTTTNESVIPIVTVTPNDTINYPKTFVIDFGTSGYIGARGNTLKGIVKVILTGKISTVNSVKIITYSNFTINERKFTGIDSITNKGINASLAPIELIKAKDTISVSGISSVIWKATRARARYDTAGTPTLADDSYSVTGSASGIASTGLPFAMYITSSNPLVCYNNLPYFIQGSLTITSNDKSALLDYGNAEMDDKATLIVGTDTIKMTLN